MRHMRLHHIAAVAMLALVVAPAVMAQSETQASKDTTITVPRMAFVRPLYNREARSDAKNIATEGAGVEIGKHRVGVSTKTSESDQAVLHPEENLARVVEKFRREARSRLNWPVDVLPLSQSMSVQDELMGPPLGERRTMRLRFVREVAERTGARFVVVPIIQELAGWVADRTGFSQRTTGRCNLEVVVFDTERNDYVWQTSVIDTSSHFGDSSVRARVDQALFNAIRKALDPMLLEGKRREVVMRSSGVLVSVQKVSGKLVVLDVDAKSDVRPGDVLDALDGSAQVRVTEVLQNGTVGEVTSGEVTEKSLLRLKD